jgi:3-oxoadipate enol-lactonase
MNKKIPLFHYGNINHIPIVFIHGFPFDHFMWQNQIEFLSRDYFCITYDIRGLGKSETDDYLFTLEDLVDDLFDVIDRSKISKPVICGLSMGGYISLRAVEKDESKFRGVILCDTKAESDNDQAKLKRAEAIKRINEEGAEAFTSEFISGLFSDESKKNLSDEYAAVLKRSGESDPKGLKACLLAMAARKDTTGYLHKIEIPTLLLCGENDKLTPPDVMKDMADKIKGSEFHVIKSAGHMSPIENPNDVNYSISSYLKKHFPVL